MQTQGDNRAFNHSCCVLTMFAQQHDLNKYLIQQCIIFVILTFEWRRRKTVTDTVILGSFMAHFICLFLAWRDSTHVKHVLEAFVFIC